MIKNACIAASFLLLATQAAADSGNSELRNMLVQDCGSCHGLRMKGGLGPALLPVNLEGKSTGFIADTILNGRPGTAMPPWKALLSRDEALWMAQQLQDGLQ